MLEVVAGLKDRGVHLLHRVAELDAEPAQDVALPGVVLCVHARLDLLVVDDADAERLLRLGRVERRARLLDLREELLPVRERVAEPVEDVFGFEVPEGLELEPLRDVLLELLDFALDKCERSLERRVGEAGQLNRLESQRMVDIVSGSDLQGKYMLSQPRQNFGFGGRFRSASFVCVSNCRQCLFIRVRKYDVSRGLDTYPTTRVIGGPRFDEHIQLAGRGR